MSENSAGHEGNGADEGITRRRVLQTAAGGAAVLGAGSLLAACGSSSSSSGSATAAAGPVKRGGTLTVGMLTGGSGETVSPFQAYQLTDTARCTALFETPVDLADSFEPNSDGTVWTLKLKSGVLFHDGKTMTADDVVYSFSRWGDPAAPGYTNLARLVDFKNVRKRDALTVEIPCLVPVAELPAFLTTPDWYAVVPKGMTDKQLGKHPIGTGPFTYVSFTPGKTSRFAAFKDYHVTGRPYLDALIIDSSFTDETARVNALASGAIQAATAIPYATAASPPSTFKASIVAKAGNFASLIMHVDTAPFNDVRVRQALRLLIDRKAWLNSIYSGIGTISNDAPVPNVEFSDASLTREQDLDQAKSLLKAAGKSDLAITLTTGAAFPGMLESATLFKQQAKAAGVTVDLKQIDVAQYFTNFLDYPFGQTLWSAFTTQAPFYTQVLTTTAPYRETRYGDKAYDKLIYDAIGELDNAKATDKWHAIQKQQYDEGGYITPATFPFTDGLAHNLHMPASKTGWLNDYRFDTAWFS